MSGEGSRAGRYLRRQAARRVVGRVGAAKLAAAAAAACLALVLCLALLAALAGASASEPGEAVGTSCAARPERHGPPAALVPIYTAAASEFRLGPRGPSILAAINKVESGYGRSPLPGVHSGTNSAGAEGPMQFLASSWVAYGLDRSGDGIADPYDPVDAIFSAAHLLHVEGAPGDWYQAIWHYNHADWYVREVLRIAAGLAGLQCSASVPAAPLSGLPAETLSRLEYAARWIQSQRIPYCWGGGHGPEPGPSPPIAEGGYCDDVDGERDYGSSEDGLDCSGAVRWLLVLAGFPDPGPIASGQFYDAFAHGPGSHVTIWSSAGHVFISIDGVDWGTSSAHFRHGPGFGDQPTTGFVASHPDGL